MPVFAFQSIVPPMDFVMKQCADTIIPGRVSETTARWSLRRATLQAKCKKVKIPYPPRMTNGYSSSHYPAVEAQETFLLLQSKVSRQL